jgi:hypothetical protein
MIPEKDVRAGDPDLAFGAGGDFFCRGRGGHEFDGLVGEGRADGAEGDVVSELGVGLAFLWFLRCKRKEAKKLKTKVEINIPVYA